MLMLHATWSESLRLVLIAAVAQAARAALGFAANASAQLASAKVKSQLRERLFAKFVALGPQWMAGRSPAQLTTVYGRGLDALDGYFSKFVPQLVLTALATPTLVLVLFLNDVTSAVIVSVTLPLIPIFMILIGWYTQRVQDAEWEASRGLAGHFVDVVTGLSTLKIFGRAGHQQEVISEVTDQYRRRTMKVLSVSFMSGFVLEICATLSVALVAVSIGTRMIAGELDLYTGLFVLLITPEAFAPLRLVGSHYHAATEGISAADDVLSILDEPVRPLRPVHAVGDLQVDNLAVVRGERTLPPVSFTAPLGAITVVHGPSGAGKSSLLGALTGTVAATGQVRIGDRVIDFAAGENAQPAIAWSGQQARLFTGTIGGNVSLGSATPDAELIERALHLAGADELSADQHLDALGEGVSGGQAQRVSVARCFYRTLEHDCPIVLLDEPTSALDEVTEAQMIAGMRELADAGRAVVVVSHRDTVRDAADVQVAIGSRDAEEVRA